MSKATGTCLLHFQGALAFGRRLRRRLGGREGLSAFRTPWKPRDPQVT